MNTKTILSAFVSSLIVVAAAPAMAVSIGDADPGYPGLVNGQYVAASAAMDQEDAAHALHAMGKTRAQVKAETLEAIRLGAIGHGERFVFPTQQQLENIRTAGLKALMPTLASGKSITMKN